MKDIKESYKEAKKIFGEDILKCQIFCDLKTYQNFEKKSYKGLKIIGNDLMPKDLIVVSKLFVRI